MKLRYFNYLHQKLFVFLIMKKILFVFLFLPLISFAQIQSGEIIYKVKSLEKSKNKTDTIQPENSTEESAKQYLGDVFAQKDQAIPYLRFNLEFNHNEALFQAQKNIAIDNGPNLDLGLNAIGGKGVFYSNLSQNENIHQKEYLKLVRINTKISDLNWEIKDEFKTIAGYQCQKAITHIYINSSHPEKEITVWFTKELPFSFGPLGMVGLPGMILGVKRFKYFIYADEIKLSKKDKKIIPPKKGEKVTIDYIKEVDKKLEEDPLKYSE